MYKRVNGIQHIGIGVSDHGKSWEWYRKYFGLDIPFFNSVAEAPLMQHYNHGVVIEKRAAMVMNLQGGCAVEIIQPTSFEGVRPSFRVQMGDLGIYITRVKTTNIKKSFELFKAEGVPTGPMVKGPDGKNSFYVKDINNLTFQVVEGNSWFTRQKHISGGIEGLLIGVSDMERSMDFYKNLIGFSKVVYDEEGTFTDWNEFIDGGKGKFRRVLLQQPNGAMGNWGQLTGRTTIELVQTLDRNPKKIFKGRQWADVGFVHLGLDVRGMYELQKDFEQAGHPFTCDSTNDLDMGNTRVHCVYIEDPDNTLIELIEVYKIPLVEKWGLFLNVQKRDPTKPLPKFMLKMMRFSRVK